jgi:hypothetical protein
VLFLGCFQYFLCQQGQDFLEFSLRCVPTIIEAVLSWQQTAPKSIYILTQEKFISYIFPMVQHKSFLDYSSLVTEPDEHSILTHATRIFILYTCGREYVKHKLAYSTIILCKESSRATSNIKRWGSVGLRCAWGEESWTYLWKVLWMPYIVYPLVVIHSWPSRCRFYIYEFNQHWLKIFELIESFLLSLYPI